MKNIGIMLGSGLMASLLFVGILFFPRSGSMDAIQLIYFGKENGNAYSRWAFGEDWYMVRIRDIIPLWNKKHPEVVLSDDEDLMSSLRKVAKYILAHPSEVK